MGQAGNNFLSLKLIINYIRLILSHKINIKTICMNPHVALDSSLSKYTSILKSLITSFVNFDLQGKNYFYHRFLKQLIL